MIATYIIAILIYWVLEYITRKSGYPKEPETPFLPKWKTGQEWTILISPGYWLAHCFKNRIDYFPKHRRMHERRRFIVANNKHNLYITIALCIFALLPQQQAFPPHLVQLIWALVTLRFISRTFEIGYAFGNDVIKRPQNRSGLSRFSRIRLALRSYVELFFLSTPVYYAHGLMPDQFKAMILSLSVGTLTNIGYAFSECHTPLAILVFLQVISTLSLVLLSLAIYVSRGSNPIRHRKPSPAKHGMGLHEKVKADRRADH